MFESEERRAVMATQPVNCQWYTYKSAREQLLALARYFTTEEFGRPQMEPTLEYIEKYFAGEIAGDGGDFISKLSLPEKHRRRLVVIPKRRDLIVKVFYSTPTRKLARRMRTMMKHPPNPRRDACRCFRNGSEFLTSALRRHGVNSWNYLVKGAHGTAHSDYETRGQDLYQQMWLRNRTEFMISRLEKNQPGDFIVFPFYVPDKPVLTSAKLARASLSRGEFCLPAYVVEYAMLAQIIDSNLDAGEPFWPKANDLKISCPGDRYPLTRNMEDLVPFFNWDSALRIELLEADELTLQRPAIGFVPPEIR
jgi:hypothetical protein